MGIPFPDLAAGFMLSAQPSQWERALVWKRLFGRRGRTIEDAPAGGGQQERDEDIKPDVLEANSLLEGAFDWLDKTADALRARNIGQFPRYDVDLAAGRIIFSGRDAPSLAFACQAVGTFNAELGTWHWGWDHPSIPFEVAGASEAVRQFGQKIGLSPLTQRQIEAAERDAWHFTALAGMLTSAVGAYRCPGAVAVYIVLYELE